MKLVMATVTDVDGTEAEPITIEATAPGVVSLTGPNGVVWDFDEVELNAALFEVAHPLWGVA